MGGGTRMSGKVGTFGYIPAFIATSGSHIKASRHKCLFLFVLSGDVLQGLLHHPTQLLKPVTIAYKSCDAATFCFQ